MSEILPEIGRVVFSRSGRDSGRYYIITALVDKDYVMIADGKVRMLAKPKKKKIKHLNLHEEVLTLIGEKLKADKKVYDKELGSALRAFNERNQ